MPASGIFLTTILLIFGAKLTSQISPPPCTGYHVPDELKCSHLSLTRAFSSKEVNCSNLDQSTCLHAVDGVANGSTAHQWMTAGHNNQGHWFNIEFIGIYRVNKIRLKQLDATYKQIKDVRLMFAGGTTIDIQLGIQNSNWQNFRFPARNTHYVKLTANSFYSADDKQYGFQEIEVYDENCEKDLICENIGVNGSAIVDSAVALVGYPITGKFVTIQVRLPETKSSETMSFHFVEEPPTGDSARSYIASFTFGITIEVVITRDSDDQSYSFPYAVEANVDYTFWFDFSSNKFAFGVGAVSLASINSAPLAISHVTVRPRSGTTVVIGICSRRGSCQADAQHHWPMDKLSGGDLLDIKGYRHALTNGGTLVNTGPVIHSGFTTAAVALDFTNNDYIDLGDFAASPLTNLENWNDGWTFAFWLRFDTLRNLSAIVDGSFISFPGRLYVQPSSVKGLDVSVVSNALLYRVSHTIELLERNWYHMTITWDPADKLTVYHNVVGKFSSVEESHSGIPTSDAHLHIGCSLDRGYSCDSISVADVVFWNKRLSEEKMMREFQCSGYQLGQSGSLGIGTGFVPKSGLTASSQRTTEVAVYAADLARAGLLASGPGSWMPSLIDSDPYLEVDLSHWVTVTEVGVQGDPTEDKWVTGYSLSYKQYVSPWTFTPYTTKHSTTAWLRPTCNPRIIIQSTAATSDGSPTVLEGAVDSSMLISNFLAKNFTTRYLRFHPKSWVGGIAMKVEVFGSDTAANYVGCYNDPGLTRQDKYDGANMTPDLCSRICGNNGIQYAIVKGGTQCFCLAVLPSVTGNQIINSELCSIPCSGNPGLPCGGIDYVAVYLVKGTRSTALTLTTPAKVNVFTNFSLSVSAVPEKDYFVDFDNGAALRSSQTSMHYVFPSPGKYNVHAWANTDDYGEPVLVSSYSEVEVVVPVSASLQCPSAVETLETFECTLYILQASDSNFNIDFYGGKSTTTGIIRETLQGVVGDEVNSGELSSSEIGVYLFPGARFPNQGKVQGLEVMATRPGVLRLLIVRPVCVHNVSESYIKSDGSSMTAPQCTPTDCTTTDMLCVGSDTCTVSTSRCLGTKDESLRERSLASSHEIVNEFLAFVHVGRNLLFVESNQLEDMPTVGPGYEIAFDSPTGIGAEVAMVNDTNRWFFFSGQPSSVGTILDESSGTLKQKGRFHVKAFYFLSSTQVITESYSNIGVFTPRARFTFDGYNIDYTSIVTVSESIAGANWTVSAETYLATNASLRVVIEPLTRGYNISGVLLYEPGDNETFFQERVNAEITYDHVYTRRGVKPLSLTLSNAISSQELQCDIHVQDIVRDLDIVEPIKPTPTGNESEIEWYLLQGSDLTFEFNLGDGTSYSNGTFDIDGVLIVYASNIYPAAGEYDVNITVYNDVSNLTLMTVAVVEDPILNLTVEVIHAARDIEVNETISLSVTMEAGTNPMYSFDFGDGSTTVLSRDSLITHAYSYWQVFEVNITVWNNVSQANITQEVVVHKPVRPLINFTVTSSPTNLTDPVAFMLNISDGTDYNCTWNFGDGSTGESDYDGLGANVYHTYSAVGAYEIFMNCSNRLYTTNYSALAIVQLPVTGFVFPQPPAFSYDNDLTFNWNIFQGTNGTYNLTYGNIINGERQLFQNDDFTLSSDRKTASYVYPVNIKHTVGVYEVTIAVWNLVTPPQYISREITIDIPLKSSLLTSAQTFWEVNRTVTVTTTMSQGTNVTLLFNFGDGTTAEEFYMGYFPTNGVNTTHVFETDGDFSVELLVSNPLNNESISLLLALQYAADLGLTSNSPQVHPPATVNFTMFVNPGKEEPTDANATWYFEDGTSVTKPFAYTETHTYSQPGWYIVVVIVFNEVSTMNVTGYADVQRPIVNPTVWAVNTAGDKGDGAPGAGPGRDIFPQDYPIRFMTSIHDGTNVTYTYDFGDGKVESTNLSSIEHQFSIPRQYSITVLVNNSVSEYTLSIVIVAQAVVKDITVTNDAPVVIENLMTFNVEIGQLGNESCFYFDLQNGTKITFKPERTTACLREFSSDVRSFTENSFTFTHEYKYITEYIVTFEGQNQASLVVDEVRAVVVGKPCFFPKAVVIEVGNNVTTARKFIKSKDIVVPTENVIDCEAAIYSRFEWKVYKYEPDKPHIPEGQNDTTFFHEMANVTGITYDAPRLVVKPRVLDYGIYRGVENVSMVGVTGVWDDDDGFFEVVKSPLLATIIGGSTRSVGFSKNFTLDANSSGDPDVDIGNREEIQVYWLCMRDSDNYTFPDDPQNLTVHSMIPLLLQGNDSNVTDQGGCFGNGPGLLNFTDYQMKLFSGYLQINETYHFRFFIRKAERSAFYDSSVQIVQGDPPEMAISCQRNCLQKFNPSEKIAVLAVCSSCTSFSRRLLLYRWTLTVKEDGKWVKVDLASIAKSSLDRDTLVIGGGTLKGGGVYRIRVDSWFPKGVPGFSQLEKIVNIPPVRGSCGTSPKEGYALKKIFKVECTGWDDTELPLRYNIWYRNGLDGLISGIYEGQDSVRSNMSLPLGKEADNYTVFIFINIMDSLGAYTTVETRVKVTEEQMSDEAFGALMDDMTSDSGALGNLIAEGNAQAMVQLIGALTSLMNNKATTSETLEVTDPPVVTEAGPQSPEELARLEKESLQREAEKKRKEEEARRKRIEAREKMVNAMASVQVDSINTVQQTSCALQSLLATPEEVSPNAQSAGSAAMEKMADFLSSNADASSGSAIESAATGLVAGLGHMISASATTVANSNRNETSSGEPANKTANIEQAKLVVAALQRATDKIFKAIASQSSVGEDPTEINSPAMSLSAVKKLPSEVAGSALKAGSGKFAMPVTATGNSSDDESPVDMKGVETKSNPFSWDSSASSVQTQVMTLELRNASGHVIPVKNLSEPISIFGSTGQTPGEPAIVQVRYREMVFHTLTVDKNDTSIHFEVTPDPNSELILFLKRSTRPSKTDYDYKQVIPDDPTENTTYPKDRHMFFISNADTNRTTAGKWYLGVYYNGTLEPLYKMIEGSQEREIYIPSPINYTLLMYASGCLFWDEENDKWRGDGCVVGPQSKMDMVQCLCTHLTSFAGDFFVMPNAIDWSAISLDNLFSNPTVFAVVMSIFGIYIIGMIWCRKKDKQDLQQIGTTPLADNDPRDAYLYELVFFTGHSAGAGTTANVYAILEGTVDETPPRPMKDPVRTKFLKSAVDTFLLAVPSSLGRLKQLHVWHDNAGVSPSWFLQRVLVQDLQTDKKTWFLCDKWLAVEEEDGLIERTLVPATRDDLTSFNLLFSTEARKSLTDSHLWFSVVKRPPRSTFTRCQRLSCCLSVILTTMLANAMFFQTDSTSSTGTELRLGPISFSVKQLSIAITSSMVVLPANILIVTLFRKAGPKQTKNVSDPNEKGQKYAAEDGNEQADEGNKDGVIKMEDDEEVKENKKKKKQKKKNGKLPHWVIYVAYAVVALASLVSATFTVFYGLTFGVEKSQKWIMTMMISFWQDVLVSQPLKVFAAATFFALVIKNPDKVAEQDDDKKEDGGKVKPDEELVHKQKDKNEEDIEDIKKLAFMPKQPDQVKLEEMRQFKLKQKLMYRIIREILSYIIFVMILLTVAYGNRDYKSHYVNNALTSYFMGGTYSGKMTLDDISDINEFYKYLRNSLLPTLKPDFWYGPFDDPVSKVTNEKGDMYALSSPGPNGTKIYSQVHPYPQGYTADRANAWLVGIPRIRQLRVIDEGCVFPKGVDHLVARCSLPYSYDYEDEGYYEPGWVPMNESQAKKLKEDDWFKSPWAYKTAWQLKGTPYWGFFHTYWAGGFVAELSASYENAVNQSIELEALNWLDSKTRAVFFEFTVYNPFTNFFAVVNILVEILATGGYYPYPYIATTRLYRYIGAEAMVIMGLEIIFFAYLLYYIVREVKELRTVGRWVYLKDPWNYFDLMVIICSILTIVFYFMRMAGTKVVIKRANDDPYSFTNFNYIVALDTMVTSFMALSVFVAFLKFMRLLRFNRRIGILSSTLKACINPLASFFLLFIIIFLAYSQFAFLIFGPKMSDYSSFHRCMANMLGMTLGSFDFDALESTNRILGPAFFFSYIMVMVMILMNVFLSIINETFNEINSDASKQSSDSDIADFMMDRLVATVKRTGATIKPIYKEPKDRLDQNLQDIEDLSDNVQLAMRSLCLESIRHTSWFKSENLEETSKKRVLMQLLMLTGENFTENEVCDAIPVLDTVLAKYSSKELKRIVQNFRERLACEEKDDAEEALKDKQRNEDRESEDSEDNEEGSESERDDQNEGSDEEGGKNCDIKFDF